MDNHTEKPATKKRGRPPILEVATCAVALIQLNGNLAAVARRFKVTRSSVGEFIDKNPGLQKVLADAREGMLDEAEGMLYKAVKKGEAWAVCFFLKTQGKGRGYVEKVEAGKGGDKGEALVIGGDASPNDL